MLFSLAQVAYFSLIIGYLILPLFYSYTKVTNVAGTIIYLEDRALCFYIQGGGSGGL